MGHPVKRILGHYWCLIWNLCFVSPWSCIYWVTQKLPQIYCKSRNTDTGSPSKKNSWTLLMFTLKFINDYVNSSDIIIMLRCRNFLKVNIIAQHSMPCCELLLNMAWFGRWLTTGWPLVCTSSQLVLSPQYRCFVLNFTGKVCFKVCYSFIDMSKK